MPLPKRRHSAQRQAKRRTHYKLTAPVPVPCKRCHAPQMPHHICGACGFYNGRQWFTPKSQVAAEAA